MGACFLALTDARRQSNNNNSFVIVNDLLVNNSLQNPGLGDTLHFVCQKLGKNPFELTGFIGVCFLVLIDARDCLYMFFMFISMWACNAYTC